MHYNAIFPKELKIDGCVFTLKKREIYRKNDGDPIKKIEDHHIDILCKYRGLLAIYYHSSINGKAVAIFDSDKSINHPVFYRWLNKAEQMNKKEIVREALKVASY